MVRRLQNRIADTNLASDRANAYEWESPVDTTLARRHQLTMRTMYSLMLITFT